jgi:hypothetical protein
MRLAKLALMIVGALATLMGLVWMAQGSGIFPYPAESFMINQSPWIWRGAMLAVAGLIAIWLGRRR